jgi:hypothetical protein
MVADGQLRHPHELVDVRNYKNLNILISNQYICIIPPTSGHACSCGKVWASEALISKHNCTVKEVKKIEKLPENVIYVEENKENVEVKDTEVNANKPLSRLEQRRLDLRKGVG